MNNANADENRQLILSGLLEENQNGKIGVDKKHRNNAKNIGKKRHNKNRADEDDQAEKSLKKQYKGKTDEFKADNENRNNAERTTKATADKNLDSEECGKYRDENDDDDTDELLEDIIIEPEEMTEETASGIQIKPKKMQTVYWKRTHLFGNRSTL
ncbi:unnamed protein product [Acanthoscelides obtectus]|uniref:Uncharacterized protein n=1 Tax=Acanthoscelides obtectus TaxID=200917 RepID=A0A9P0PPH6_ACAOB|nr:unnamed protein product [Acanthoscelides obtectus]CAK1666150.1 hypothetical protein AOBTE_LOCUS25178 [Acanthoscelides obtectus]